LLDGVPQVGDKKPRSIYSDGRGSPCSLVGCVPTLGTVNSTNALFFADLHCELVWHTGLDVHNLGECVLVNRELLGSGGRLSISPNEHCITVYAICILDDVLPVDQHLARVTPRRLADHGGSLVSVFPLGILEGAFGLATAHNKKQDGR